MEYVLCTVTSKVSLISTATSDTRYFVQYTGNEEAFDRMQKSLKIINKVGNDSENAWISVSSTPVSMSTALEMQTAAGYKVLDGNLIWAYEPRTLRCDDVVPGARTTGVRTAILKDDDSEGDADSDDDVFYEILDMAIKISSELFNGGIEQFLFGPADTKPVINHTEDVKSVKEVKVYYDPDPFFDSEVPRDEEATRLLSSIKKASLSKIHPRVSFPSILSL